MNETLRVLLKDANANFLLPYTGITAGNNVTFKDLIISANGKTITQPIAWAWVNKNDNTDIQYTIYEPNTDDLLYDDLALTHNNSITSVDSNFTSLVSNSITYERASLEDGVFKTIPNGYNRYIPTTKALLDIANSGGGSEVTFRQLGTSTDTSVDQLIINIGTQAQIDAGIQSGTITDTQLSFATDNPTFAELDSPAFTGTPTAPTATAGTNNTQIATTAFVQNAISEISPGSSYIAGTGIDITNNTINHSNAITAGTVGTTSATSGSTLDVPYVTYDAQGHVTATGTHTHTVSGFLTSSDVTSDYSSSGTTPVNGTAVASAINSFYDTVADKNLSNLSSTGNNKIATLAMPSATSVTLSIDVSGATYTAPNNGWFVIAGSDTSTIIQGSNTANNLGYNAVGSGDLGALLAIPCKAGHSVTIRYSGSIGLFRFVYAEGAI